ncbi:protein BLISTER isoform X2 [Coffea arabica]|uniref:Protein BLISTER isoform X2 n=1 Tax=Coffea arabica TaxID=13443 RepID=A0A6P6WU93_COFAR|nr:protein BLISTER isoform X2 [Coffea arabica]
MASAQVMRKQDHLEAGKRKLEEFRKKKAAERSKKTTSVTQINTSDGGSHEKQLSDSERVRLVDSDVAGTSDAVGAAVSEPSGVVINKDSKETEASQKSSFTFSHDESANLPPVNEFAVNTFVPLHSQSSDKEFRGDDTSQLNADYGPQNKKGIDGALDSTSSGVAIDQTFALHLPSENIGSTSRPFGYDGLYDTLSSNSDSYLKDLSVTNSKRSHSFTANGFPEDSGTVFLPENSGYGNHMFSNHMSSSFGGESKFNSGSAQLSGANNLSPWSSSNYRQQTLSSETNVRRSRPSFLDSINISRGPSASPPMSGPKVELLGSKVHPEDTLSSYPAQNSTQSSVALGNGADMFKQVMDKGLDNRQELYPRKQDEDFAALEQHIEDLTQEKFSLQRALDASRALAESLAAENSALTDNYNQQGSAVNQLKSDMEKLQEEIRANLVELEAVRIEYGNAQLECNAADERARLLASEVIGLEEKALRLRSNELKLERQLEESQAEISSFKKKMSSLEKDRQDLQSTIAALQEEKKLLQSKLRKASGSGKAVEVSKSPTSKKDVSTSTEDLGENHDVDTSTSTSNMEGNHGNDSSSIPLLHDNRDFNLQDLSLAIPPDQTRMIENINTLISELTLEKEELAQALFVESSQSSKLKDLNKELTRKLEVQTQRLELLTAQSMVNDVIPVRQPDTRTVNDNIPYADEGDEVVERVLGWIMKLFPGGPSRRRSSKLL